MNSPLSRIFAVLTLAVLPPVFAQDAKPLVVIDLRPDEEKAGSKLTELTGKCNKDVYRIPDVASDPLKVELLRRQITEQLGLAGEGKTLTVLDWSIYYNRQVQHSGGIFKNVGIQGYSVPGQDEKREAGSKCTQKESAGGWYKADELSSVYFPLISEFQGTFGGKPVKVRVVYSPHAKLPGKFEGDKEDTQALLEAVQQTGDALAAATAQ